MSSHRLYFWKSIIALCTALCTKLLREQFVPTITLVLICYSNLGFQFHFDPQNVAYIPTSAIVLEYKKRFSRVIFKLLVVKPHFIIILAHNVLKTAYIICAILNL